MLHHSDRGSQYASDAYRELLHRHGATPSMSRPANCYDNAKMESSWATLKGELIGDRVFATRAEAKTALFDYIEVFYNRRRLHRALDFPISCGLRKQPELKHQRPRTPTCPRQRGKISLRLPRFEDQEGCNVVGVLIHVVLEIHG